MTPLQCPRLYDPARRFIRGLNTGLGSSARATLPALKDRSRRGSQNVCAVRDIRLAPLDERGRIRRRHDRWPLAMVSTSITAIVAGTMAWLALTAMPPLHSSAQAPTTTFLPYRVFADLARAGRDFASNSFFGSAVVPGKPALRRPAPVSDDDSGDDGNATPGIETRTLTVEKGDTLAGLLEDAGVPNGDANAVVAALEKVYDVRTMARRPDHPGHVRSGARRAAAAQAGPAPRAFHRQGQRRRRRCRFRQRRGRQRPGRAGGAHAGRAPACDIVLTVGRAQHYHHAPDRWRFRRRRRGEAAGRAFSIAPAPRSTPRSTSLRHRPAIPTDVVVSMIKMVLLQDRLPARHASRRRLRGLLQLLLHAGRTAREGRRHRLCPHDHRQQKHRALSLSARCRRRTRLFRRPGREREGAC